MNASSMCSPIIDVISVVGFFINYPKSPPRLVSSIAQSVSLLTGGLQVGILYESPICLCFILLPCDVISWGIFLIFKHAGMKNKFLQYSARFMSIITTLILLSNITDIDLSFICLLINARNIAFIIIPTLNKKNIIQHPNILDADL